MTYQTFVHIRGVVITVFLIAALDLHCVIFPVTIGGNSKFEAIIHPDVANFPEESLSRSSQDMNFPCPMLYALCFFF